MEPKKCAECLRNYRSVKGSLICRACKNQKRTNLSKKLLLFIAKQDLRSEKRLKSQINRLWRLMGLDGRPRGEEREAYTKYKLEKCESCPFVPIHPCQLDVHHLDGNAWNNEPGNLKTLCANCHRLVTFFERRAKKKVSAI